jgi:uncharacterized Zn-binding protein involved in type VI secretion
LAGLDVARVGDIVTYQDGSQAVVTSGAGEFAISQGKPFALVGSELDNGDTITDSSEWLGMSSSALFVVVRRLTVTS